jgi:PKD domain
MRLGAVKGVGAIRRARLLSGALAAVLLCVVPSSAAASGLAAEDHVFPAPAVDATDADSTIAPNGFAAAAWVETLSGGQSQVDVAVRPPGGDWSAPQPLGATTMSIGDLHVTINSSGGAAVAWEDTMPPSTFVAAISTRRAGGTFGMPETVSNGDEPRVGIDASGNVTFLYDIVNSAASNGEFVREAPAGSSIMTGLPHTLSSTCSGFGADLAVAPNGDAIAGFSCGSVAFALRKAGTWGTATTPFVSHSTACPTIGISTNYFGVRVAIDSTSHPIGVVEETDTQADCMGGFFNTRKDLIFLAASAGGVMAAGGMVAQSDTGFGFTPVPNDVSSPTVGIGGGSAVVGWRASDSNGVHSQMATRTFTGNGADAPSAVQLFGDPAANTGEGQVWVDQAGDTLLTWTDAPTSGKLVSFAAFRPSGGAFGQSLPASDGTGDAVGLSGGIDDTGDGIVGWLQSQGTAHTVHARGFDVTPPQLTTVSAPASARAGTPTAFAAQASDVWGPVSFSWSFGDGTAVGASPSHTFLTAGPHAVTVTATDSAGNASSRNGTVFVTAAPGGNANSRPTLMKVRQSHAVFRVGTKPTAIAAATKRPPIGTTFRFSLDRAATVTITISRSEPGRRSGKRCVKPTGKLAHNKRCTRSVRAGVLTRHGKQASNSVAFSGRVGRRALKPGSYIATFVATAGSRSSSPKILRFKIVH